MVEIDTLFQTETAKKNLLARHIQLIEGTTPGAKNALQITSLAGYASETNNTSVKCENPTNFL